MALNKITNSAIVLSILLVGPVAAQQEAGILSGANPGLNQPRQAADQFLNQIPSSTQSTSVNSEPTSGVAKPSHKSDTVRRYRDSGRVLFLGGPEAFSI